MTPAAAIAMLERQLTAHGQDIVVRKTNSATDQVTVRAKVRFYKPDEVVGIIVAGDSKIVISPTGLESFGVPPSNGFVVVDGAPRRIIAANPIHIAGELVRIDLQVRG